ncbi:uncharacterized protein LOC117111725 isoform X4 [Anneissia japonica]|uniref:uncharacterized protein LOC117111725 isoform X4 n=1 Tax=Anneissia japonica TaxID=1529436 RepID=UPI0014255C30|nr:uncharacterized protein LOC117111725 isoform X4 [Anneissia japonica]
MPSEMADMAQYSLTKQHSLLRCLVVQMKGKTVEVVERKNVLHTRTPTKSTRSFYGTMDYIESPDIEKEVKRLLRMDSTAIRVRILSSVLYYFEEFYLLFKL